jgi:hypothetical protein
LCIFCQKVALIFGHCVIRPFVFIHIPGGSFIFNISLGERAVPDLDQRIGEPPQLTQVGIFNPFYELTAGKSLQVVSRQERANSSQPTANS